MQYYIKVTGDSFFRRIKTTEENINMPPYCLGGVTQVSRSPDIRIKLEAFFSKSGLWTQTLYPTLHRHSGE